MSDKSPWTRVVLKFSGEALADPTGAEIIDFAVAERLAREVAEARAALGVDIAMVVGGGNIWRGSTGAAAGMDSAAADYMGMLGTVINALALQEALERAGQPTRVQTAIDMDKVAEPYIRRRAIRHLEKGRVVILAGGLGAPFFTTDTGAALRAAEIGADCLLKGTHGGVDGVYTADPKLDPTATKMATVTFREAIEKELRVMDLTALTLCKENSLPICVFDLMTEGNIGRALRGEPIGTMVQ